MQHCLPVGTRIAADVYDPDSIKAALRDRQVVLSGLGVADGDPPGTLTAGARAVTEAHPDRIIWLGALGTGASAQAGGRLVRALFRAMEAKLAARVSPATVAAAMLDEAESPRFPGTVAIPLDR
jgi:hypothetical protein